MQFAIFIAMFIVLRQFLFKPYMQMREDRAHRISSAETAAAETKRPPSSKRLQREDGQGQTVG